MMGWMLLAVAWSGSTDDGRLMATHEVATEVVGCSVQVLLEDDVRVAVQMARWTLVLMIWLHGCGKQVTTREKLTSMNLRLLQTRMTA